MPLDNLSPTPIDIAVTWAVEVHEASTYWKSCLAVDRYLRWNGVWCWRRPPGMYYLSGDPPPDMDPRAAHEFHGRLLAIHPDQLGLVMEATTRRLVMIPIDALRVSISS